MKWKEAKKMFISFRFEAKQSEKTFISFRLEAKQKIRSKTKRNEKFLEAKQSENTVYLFRFGWKRKIWSEKKRNEAKKIFFFRVSVRNACETDLVSLCFALKRKNFWSETGAP